MKPNRQAVVYYLISLMTLVSSIMWFVKGNKNSGFLWLTVCIVNLVLGTLWLNKARNIKAEMVEAYNKSVAQYEAENIENKEDGADIFNNELLDEDNDG